MVKYNLTVDDISPLISYEGNWGSLTVNNPGDEGAIQSFNNSTLHALNSNGSATLQFAGQAISVWGPSRSDSSGYKVVLDGTTVPTVGSITGPNESNLLYWVSGLAPGLPHTLQIINAPLDPQRSWLRIDKFIVESETDGDNVSGTIIDDSDSSIHYDPNQRLWSKGSDDNSYQSAYYGGTLHAINMTPASLEFTTEGDSVEIYGGQDLGFSSFAVTVDGSRRIFWPNVRDFHAQVLLFQTEFLQSSGIHTVKIEVLEKKRFEFDFVRVVRFTEGASATLADITSSPSPTNPSSSLKEPAQELSGPAIAGIVLGCMAILALIGLALLLRSRKRRRRLPPSAAFIAHLDIRTARKNTPIYEEFSSNVYRPQSTVMGEQSSERSMEGLDLLDGQSELVSAERSKYEPYLSMYKTGAVRSTYEATLRPEDSASLRVRSPLSEVGSQVQNDRVTYFTPTISAALPPLPERY